MAGLSKETLRGYILEELLARLIQNTGYRLLVDESQDVDELENRPNGLAVRGRGGSHQVDVLGELAWIPAFTFPIRLIVEAKARIATSGIEDVRNAVGVITDVNQNYSRASPTVRTPVQKFAYRYALFSTSGFSRPAAEFALAHQISLIDLSSPDFDDLVSAANDVTEILWEPDPPTRAAGWVRGLRARIRVALGTWPLDGPRPPLELTASGLVAWPDAEARLREAVDSIGELFVGMANGPYLLVLRADRSDRALAAFDAEPLQFVSIHWSSRRGRGTEWTVTPADRPEAYQLVFTIPPEIAEWIFDEDADSRRRALEFKEQFLSTITIYRYVDGRDRLYRLSFSREQVSATWDRRDSIQ